MSITLLMGQATMYGTFHGHINTHNNIRINITQTEFKVRLFLGFML